MPLIKDGKIVEDAWVRLSDEEPLPAQGDVIVSYERLPAIHNEIGGRKGRTGVAVPNTIDARDLADLLPHIALVALHFPAFTDGRAYSQGWLLRNELGFTGELRATGNVLADQAAFMHRCGFDAFETDGRQPIEVWARAARSVTLAYQRGYRGEGFATRDKDKDKRARDRSPPGATRGASHDAAAHRLTLGASHLG